MEINIPSNPTLAPSNYSSVALQLEFHPLNSFNLLLTIHKSFFAPRLATLERQTNPCQMENLTNPNPQIQILWSSVSAGHR